VVWALIFTPRVTKPAEPVMISLVPPKRIEINPVAPPPLPHLAPKFSAAPAPPVIVMLAPAPPAQTITTRQNPAPPSAAPPGPPAAPPLPPPDYLSRLMAHLNAYKNYPYDARRRHAEGTVRLRFRMDRQGHVLFYDVVGSSGSPELDDEARAMILRAAPLPAVPPDFPGDVLDLVVPVVFSLH
jgi:periplasmic protein TonB